MAAPTLTSALTEAVLTVYSTELLHNALGAMMFLDFAVKREDLLARSGKTLTFTKYADVTGDPAIAENATIADSEMSASTVSITVQEYAKAISVSEFLVQASWDDVLEEAALLLGRHYAVWGPDYLLRKTLMANAGSTVYANSRAGRTSLVAGDYMDTDLIRNGVETLQTLNAPKFNTGTEQFYVCFLHPHQARYLRQDPDWIAAQNYHQTRALFTGEIGRFEDVVFVETSHCFNGTAAAATDPSWYTADADAANDLARGNDGNAVDVYAAHLLGDYAVGFASGLPVEMRDKGVVDYGRTHGLAWYSIYGAGMIHDTYAVNLETA